MMSKIQLKFLATTYSQMCTKKFFTVLNHFNYMQQLFFEFSRYSTSSCILQVRWTSMLSSGVKFLQDSDCQKY